MELILASASPRRRELLSRLGVEFRVVPAAVEEQVREGEPPDEAVLRLARLKADRVAASLPVGLVLGADTLVAVDGRILGKPIDLGEMEQHLRLLSGRMHRVLTGLCLIEVPTLRSASAVEVTEVEFDALSEAEIRWYLDSGEGWDKAGSYATQGLASLLIHGIRGCYFNVVGLPLARLCALLAELGWKGDFGRAQPAR